MADQPATPSGMTDTEVVAAVRRLVLPAERAHDTRIKDFDRCYEAYRSKADHKQTRIPDWRARTRIPYAQYTIDAQVVGITSGMPRCIVHPKRAQDVLAAQAMQQVMDHYIAADHLAEKQAAVAQSALVYGVAAAKNTWGYAEQGKTCRMWLPDSSGNLRPVVQQQTVVCQDGPCFEPWDPYMFNWDPNARDVESARYVILASWVSKDYLMENQFNADSGKGLYRNVEELFATAAPSRKQDTAQERYYGGSQNKRDGLFLLEEIWTDSTVLVIGNGKVLLRAESNPYWHGQKPIVAGSTRPDMLELRGISEVDMVSDIQGTMHTLQNMVLDALKLTVLRGVTYREGSVVDPAMINLRPNFKWGVGDHDDIRAFEVPQLGSDVYQMLTSLLGDMERVTGVSAYLTGADSSTINQTTASGVTALQSAANSQLKFKAQQLHNKVFQRTYEQWGELIQQYVTAPVELEITGDAGQKTWVRVDPQQVVGDFRYRLEGSEESISRQAERTEAVNLLNALTPLIQLGAVNAEPLIEKVAASYDIMPPEQLVKQQQALPAPAPGGQGGGQPALPPPFQGQQPLMNGQQLPGSIGQAITNR